MHTERNDLVRMSKKIRFGDPVEVHLSSSRVKVEFGSDIVILGIIILKINQIEILELKNRIIKI